MAYLQIIRPKQWYKNLLLFVGIAFSKNLGNFDLLQSAILGFLAFCALSGSTYILNDIVDRKRDLAHPTKCKRPIPSGRMSLRSAGIYGILLATGAFLAAIVIGPEFIMTLFAYLAVAVSYSFYFKNIIILDGLLIAAGFVVRAIAGAVAVSVPISPWLIISVFLLALVLAFGKRRHELAMLGDEARDHRQVLKEYSLHMVEDMMLISVSTLIMAYSMYTFLAANQWMMLTIPFAIYGLLRYMSLVHTGEEGGGDVDLIFRDLPSVLNLVCWVLIILVILYYAPEIDLGLGG